MKGIKEDILVVAADMMCQDEKFDIAQLIKFYRYFFYIVHLYNSKYITNIRITSTYNGLNKADIH